MPEQDVYLGEIRDWSIRDAGTHFYVHGYLNDKPFVSKRIERVSVQEAKVWTREGWYRLFVQTFPFETAADEMQ